MNEARLLAIIAGGVGGAVGAFVGVSVGGDAVTVAAITLGVAVVVGVAVVASAMIAGDVTFTVEPDVE